MCKSRTSHSALGWQLALSARLAGMGQARPAELSGSRRAQAWNAAWRARRRRHGPGGMASNDAPTSQLGAGRGDKARNAGATGTAESIKRLGAGLLSLAANSSEAGAAKRPNPARATARFMSGNDRLAWGWVWPGARASSASRRRRKGSGRGGRGQTPGRGLALTAPVHGPRPVDAEQGPSGSPQACCADRKSTR